MRLPAQLRKRNPDSHKGSCGHLFALGASTGLSGALCLCVKAALRSGCGLVTAGVPESLNSIFEVKLTEVMSLPLKSTAEGSLSQGAFDKIKEFSKKADALTLGCGASCNLSTRKLILKIIDQINKPQIIDADGINALSANPEVLKKRTPEALILTPHLGEFSRLVKKDILYIKKTAKELAKEFALRYNLVLVLKGRRTIVTDGKGLFENKTGNAGMATAGTGDVLTGIISSFVAQGIDLFEAAKIGVYLHGLAADIAVKDKTENCLIASDIIEYLPKAIKTMPR